ncbi:MAG: hypothetical protein JW821_11095 [Deltaproteobacteria bacterium]|nr:hypothetical protein [Deltaproteobacteria bacterium]
MRTTLTLDDDVAVLIKRAREKKGGSFKDTVNDALRLGLKDTLQPDDGPRQRYQTPSVDAGRCLLGNVDDVSEAMALADGDSFR